MYLNSFSVRIPEGTELDGGYVELVHNTQYKLVLRNNKSVRCDAIVEIDGKQVGTWRIYAKDSITLERPAHDDGKFTFYEIGTSEAQIVGLRQGDPNLGLVKVVFTPELIPILQEMCAEAPEIESFGGLGRSAKKSVAGGRHSPGGTGLSGQSNQKFVTVDAIELDYSQQTVIYLRLVAKKNNSQPRPLTSFSTPVPPPIG